MGCGRAPSRGHEGQGLELLGLRRPRESRCTSSVRPNGCCAGHRRGPTSQRGRSRHANVSEKLLPSRPPHKEVASARARLRCKGVRRAGAGKPPGRKLERARPPPAPRPPFRAPYRQGQWGSRSVARRAGLAGPSPSHMHRAERALA